MERTREIHKRREVSWDGISWVKRSSLFPFSSYSGSHHFDSSVPLAIVVPPLFIRRSEEYMALCLCFESAPRLFPISLYELYHATPWYPNEGCFHFWLLRMDNWYILPESRMRKFTKLNISLYLREILWVEKQVSMIEVESRIENFSPLIKKCG